jgi:hypothetical protein
MTVSDLKDLEKLIKLCRKTGVEVIKIDGIELVLGAEPVVRNKRTNVRKDNTAPLGEITEDMKIPLSDLVVPTDTITEEQMLFGSSDPEVWNNQQ